jgi:hypothetical protein
LILNPFIPLFFKDGDVRMYSPKEIISNFERYGFKRADTIVEGNALVVSMRKMPQ